MADIGDSDLAAYVEIQSCCILEQEDTVLAKAQELLRSSKSTPHVHNVSPAEDSRQVAKDAVGVLQAFENISAELGTTNDAAFKKQWDDNYKAYRELLEDTVKLAEQGSKYIQSFYDTVVARFGKDDVDWEKDKNLIADFVKANGGEKIVEQTTRASQKFADLKYNTQSFHEQYADNATKKGQVYNAKLKEINTNRSRVQARIDSPTNTWDSTRTSAAQLRGSMSRAAGPGFLLGWLVRGVLALLGIGTFNMAGSRLGALEREEQQLLSEKAAIDQQADALLKQESALAQTRYGVSVLADNMSDISGRLDVLAQTWAEANRNFVEMGELLKLASESPSRGAFMGRLNLIAESTSTLTANMRAYMDDVAPGGVLVKPQMYIRSRFIGTTGTITFDDTKDDLHPTGPIATIFMVVGSGLEGLHVVYRLKDGSTRRVNHGTDRQGAIQIVVETTEYVNGVWVWLANGGNYVTHLMFEITNSTNGAKRRAGM
ncbi:hypothetical protein FRC06_008760 [Ceratobasidium sp. 370]|nr:hypothetical protein FRC06_008760 [Ceratobasidium sp. 370]